MKTFATCTILLISLAAVCLAQQPPQAPQPQAPPQAQQTKQATGDTITVSFGLTPITLPNAPSSIAGAESDVVLPFTTNNWIGETSIVSSNYSFVGGKYMRILPAVGKYMAAQNAMFANSDIGLTASAGVVFVNGKKHWGSTAGMFWLQNINDTWGMGFDAEAVRFPDVADKWTWKLAVGPQLKF